MGADPVAEIATPGSTLANQRRDYTLTPDGHRTSVATTDAQGIVTTEDYDSGPDRHHYIAIDGATQATDADGRLVSDGPRTYHYDAVDQLVRVEEAGVTLSESTYDALGRLKTVTRAGTTTRYVHSGPWVIEEYVSTAGGPESLEAVYTHASGVDDLIMSTRRDHADLDGDGSTSDFVDLFHHKNLVGTTQELFLEDGTVVESYRYDAFGAPTVMDASGQVVAAPPSGNPFLFTGRQYDAATGLYDYRARSYDPSTGRFLQEDPLGYADGLNPVAYVMGNPVTTIDPYGTKGLRAAARDLMDFVKGNGSLLASIGIDLLGPLGDILDVVSGAVGKDIRGYIEGGFKKLKGLSTWKRIKLAAGGAVRALGGAINLVGKIKKAIKKAKEAIAKHRAKKAAEAARRRQTKTAPGCRGTECFVTGTAVWLACGIAIPIEEIRLGDMVEVSEEHSAEYGLATVAGSANPLLRLQDEDCEWVAIEGWVETGDDDVEVELLRPVEWLEQNLAESASGEVGLWIDFPEARIEGFVQDLVLTRFERPTDWNGIGSGSAMPVISILRSVSDGVGTLTVGGEEIGVTGGHWIWSRTQGRWVEAGNLAACDELVGVPGRAPVLERCFAPSIADATVWTLEVAGARTFLVGQSRIVAHNAGSCPGQRFSDEKQALVEMAKHDKKVGMTTGDMEAYKDLNRTLPDPFPVNKVRGPERHPNRPHGKNWHGHVEPVDHIPITDK